MRDLDNIVELGTGYLAGDLDTITPYGNVAILSVDDEAENGIASAIMPWIKEIDTRGPQVLRAVPADGEENVPLSSRVGIGFNEMIEPSSVFAGSIRLYDAQGNAVDGWGSGQEAIANYTPKQPLLPNMTYTIEVVVDGVRDINDNAIEYTFSSTFSTVGGSQ